MNVNMCITLIFFFAIVVTDELTFSFHGNHSELNLEKNIHLSLLLSSYLSLSLSLALCLCICLFLSFDN